MVGPDAGLLFDFVTAMAAALVGAFVALKLRQSVIVGYLLAGMAIGPFTPGFIGDTAAVEALAEIGIIFLMFVIGVQLSFRELLRAGRVALVGATVQVLLTIAAGFLIGRLVGWSSLEALFFGAVVSNSSSTVLAKVFGEQEQAESGAARVALAWSSVQDLGTVVIVGVLSAIATAEGAQTNVEGTVLRAFLFLGVLVPLALFALPRLVERVAALRNRELFVMAAGCVALGMSYVSGLLGVSTAIGAFLAGAILGDSHLAHRILGETMPLRDLFSGLFFVSVGMLIDPRFILSHAGVVLMGTACIVILKGAIALALSRGLGSSWSAATLIAAGLSQSAEFSLLMARLGQSLGAVSSEVFNTMLSSTALSILIVPRLTRLAMPFGRWLAHRSREAQGPESPENAAVSDHVVVCGHGRVGKVVTELLREHQVPYVVIEEDEEVARALRNAGDTVVLGDAARTVVLERAGVARGKLVVVAIPDRMATRQVVEHARGLNATVTIVARTHSVAERAHLYAIGISEAVLGELELALELCRSALRAAGVDEDVVAAAVERVRRTGRPRAS